MLRRLLRLTAACVIALLFATTPAVSAATISDFVGTWVSVDAVDGSDQAMRITRGGQILLFDSSATVCDGAPAVVLGRGTIAGDDLEVSLRAVCVGGSGGVVGAEATFTYDAGTDTLTDSLGGTVWHRP